MVHGESPLVEAVLRARADPHRPLQIPGHKNRYAVPGGATGVERMEAPWFDLLHGLVRDDVPLQGGADDNAFSGRYLDQAEALYAQAIGADHSRFLVGGSSQGNIAALMTLAGDGAAFAVDRTSHRSAHAGLVLSGAMPHWVVPEIHPEFGIPVGVRPDCLAGLPQSCAGVFVTSPSYFGTLSGVRELAGAAHARGVALVVDQAWGAHLDFTEHGGALRAGADLSITSIHKALMGYSQTATVSSRTSRVDPARLDRCVDMTATTSPSATLLASIDASRQIMATDGRGLVSRAAEVTATARTLLRRVRGLVVLDEATLGCAVDPLKLCIFLPGTGAQGADVAADLWARRHGVESADSDRVVMTVSVADDPHDILATVAKLIDIIESHRGQARQPAPVTVWRLRPQVVMAPRAAMFAPRQRVELAGAADRVSAEQFCPYPPGVPILAPGERITEEVIEAIGVASRVGRVAYASDRSLRTIEVVA